MKDLQKVIDKFYKETGYMLVEKDGGLYYDGSLDLSHTNITSLPDNLTVCDSLNLSHTNITKLPDNLTVCGYLDVSYTNITSLPDNLTVGWSLDLQHTKITSLPDNLTLDGCIYTDDSQNIDTSKVSHNIPQLISWQNGKYIKVDGLFTEVLKHKGNVYKVKEPTKDKIFYLVTDGEGHYAHGDTIKDAKSDLIYKICDRDKSDYENLTLETTLTFKDAIECYRVITGSCSTGTKMFIESNPDVKKDTYTIKEMIELTEGQYKSEDFKSFFIK